MVSWYTTERTNMRQYKIKGDILYFPTDFFDDPRVQVVSEMPEGDKIVVFWIRFMFLGAQALGLNEDGKYVLVCHGGRIYSEEEICAITNTAPQTARYVLSILVHFGAYAPINAARPESD